MVAWSQHHKPSNMVIFVSKTHVMEQVRNDVEFDVELSLFVQITIICLSLIKQFMLIDSYLAKLSLFTHYENTLMQYTAIFHGCKTVHFLMIFF